MLTIFKLKLEPLLLICVDDGSKNNLGLVMFTKMLFHFKTNRAGFWPHHDNKPKKLTKKLTAPLKMESVTIIFSMFRLVTVEILSYGVR